MEETTSSKPPIGDDMIGRRIGQYEIVRELGRGGMATVYLARQPSMGRNVAIKVLPREFLHDPQFIERFKREVRLIAELEHPHILPVHEFGEFDRIPFIVMRFLGGGSLREMLQKGLPPLASLRRPVEQVCSALDFAHAEGIIHRDLKPSNIMLDERGNAYLSDFGIAQIMQDAGRLTGSAVIGTPAYMSPEQAEGRPLDARSDVYSMGVVLFELLTAHEPFQADTPMAMLLKQITEPMPSPRVYRPDLPESIERVVLKATSKDPASRYASAGDLARAFIRAIEAIAEAAERPPAPELDRTFVPGAEAGETGTRTRSGAVTGEVEDDAFMPTLVGDKAAPAKTAAPSRQPTPARPTPAPQAGQTAASAASTPVPAEKPARRRGGLLIGVLALLAVVVVGGGIALYASGAFNPPPVPTDVPVPTNTPGPTDTPGPTPTFGPPTPFPGADPNRGPDGLYQISLPSEWQRERQQSNNEIFLQWYPDDQSAMAALRIYNIGRRVEAQYQAIMQQYDQDYFGDDRYFTPIDEAEQPDGSLRFSYRVPQPGGLYGQFGPGQVDVFYAQEGVYLRVLEIFTADEVDAEELLPLLQNVLDSMYVNPAVEWGEPGPAVRRGSL